MQIRELVLYGYNGKVRHLPFLLGKVNIITGRQKSGKSAIGDIIDYCMGGDSCNIADGVVRDNVSWYGLLLQFDNERVFVARKNPDKGQQTTSASYIEVGEKIEVPILCDFSANTNSTGIERALTQRLGISENLNMPPNGQSRLPLAANIRHALYYCFQGQDEIAAKNFLFHRQSDSFVSQAIKDTIPYFLGAISEDALALENERAVLTESLYGGGQDEETLENSVLDFSDTDNGTHHLGADSAYLFAELTDIIDSTPHVEDCTTMKQPRQKKMKGQNHDPVMGGV